MTPLKGFTVWLTGLPGAGKSTLAGLLDADLRARGLPVELLDGDAVRKQLSRELGFTRADRDEHIRRIAAVAKDRSGAGKVVIVAAISPYAHSRREARGAIKNFVEVFVHCPLHVCVERDPKGLYAKAQRGEIPHFTGISDPYEEPEHPEIVVATHMERPEESLRTILRHLDTSGLIRQRATM